MYIYRVQDLGEEAKEIFAMICNDANLLTRTKRTSPDVELMAGVRQCLLESLFFDLFIGEWCAWLGLDVSSAKGEARQRVESVVQDFRVHEGRSQSRVRQESICGRRWSRDAVLPEVGVTGAKVWLYLSLLQLTGESFCTLTSVTTICDAAS